MSRFENIVQNGNRTQRASEDRAARVHCADGFSMSVIAGGGCYCRPRPGDAFVGTPHNYAGPYHHVEVGYPTDRPEPWGAWEPYQMFFGQPTEAVYGYVPVAMVRALIEAHGGEVAT